MAQVFISYSSRHRELTRDLVVRLVTEGYSVWWDRELEAWGEYEPQINEALLVAEVVVVIWSPGAVASRFVKAEVERALLARKLVNLRAPDFPLSDVPLNYSAVDHILTLDLDDLGPVMKTIGTVCRGEVLFGARQLHEHYRERFGESLFDPRRQALPSDPAMVTPSVLLQAPFEVATFADAAGVLADMLDWCQGTGSHAETGRAVAGRLLHGPGGLGKTRLMIEVVRRLRTEGWLAGFYPAPPAGDPARSDLRRLAIQQVTSHGPEAGVLMVLDYAESRAADVIELARMARKRPDDAVRLFRIVLLARGEGWWTDIYRTEPEVQVVFNKRGAPHGDLQVAQPLPEGPERLKVFDAMRATLAPIVTAQAAAGHFPPVSEAALPQDRRERLASSPAYARPLALQMEALLSLAGEGGGEIAELLESVLLLERKHWRKVIAGLADDARREMAMRRGISQVTALGGVDTRPALQRLMQRDPYFGQRAPVDMPLAELNQLYGRGEAWVAPLEPDLIGEHELLVSGDEDLLDACRAWIDGLPEPDRSTRRRILFTVLQRAARAEHGARAGEAESLLQHLVAGLTEEEVPDLIAVAIETAGPIEKLLRHSAPEMAEAVLVALANAFPSSTIALAAAAEKVSSMLVLAARVATHESERTEADDDVLVDRLLLNSRHLRQIGRQKEALVATKEALEVSRRLVALDEVRFKPSLAVNLYGHSVILNDLSQYETALLVNEESISVHQSCEPDRRDQWELYLAKMLMAHSAILFNLGQDEESRISWEKSASIYRRLSSIDPEAEKAFALCLANNALRLKHNGQVEAAWNSAKEGVEICRRLVAKNSDANEDQLAHCLLILSECFADLSRNEDAIPSAEEAVTLFRRLAAILPSVHLKRFSDSIVHLLYLYDATGRSDSATEVEEELLGQYRSYNVSVSQAAYLANKFGSRAKKVYRKSSRHRAIRFFEAAYYFSKLGPSGTLDEKAAIAQIIEEYAFTLAADGVKQPTEMLCDEGLSLLPQHEEGGTGTVLETRNRLTATLEKVRAMPDTDGDPA